MVPRARPALPVGLGLNLAVPACFDANSVIRSDEFAFILASSGQEDFSGRGTVAKPPRDG